MSTCDGIRYSFGFQQLADLCHFRGIIAFENGTALGIWPLDGAEQYSSRKHPHFLYRVKWTKDASCGALTQLPQHRVSHVPIIIPRITVVFQMFAKRDVRRQAKYVELALIADHHFVSSTFARRRKKIVICR